jgi:hypothetical protein
VEWRPTHTGSSGSSQPRGPCRYLLRPASRGDEAGTVASLRASAIKRPLTRRTRPGRRPHRAASPSFSSGGHGSVASRDEPNQTARLGDAAISNLGEVDTPGANGSRSAATDRAGASYGRKRPFPVPLRPGRLGQAAALASESRQARVADSLCWSAPRDTSSRYGLTHDRASR